MRAKICGSFENSASRRSIAPSSCCVTCTRTFGVKSSGSVCVRIHVAACQCFGSVAAFVTLPMSSTRRLLSAVVISSKKSLYLPRFCRRPCSSQW